MSRYTVTIVETVETHYEVEVEAETEDQAKLTAEDIIVNHEEAREASIQSEKQVDISRHAKLEG